MTEISKAAHYRSFYEVAKMLPDDERLAFYDTLDLLRFEGPEAVDFEALPFNVRLTITTIKPIIDADVGRKDGGAPEGNRNAAKGPTCRKCTRRNNCADVGKIEAEFCPSYNEKGQNNQNNRAKTTVDLALKTTSQNNLETTAKTIGPKQAKTNNVNVNDNVNVNGNGNDNGENAEPLPPPSYPQYEVQDVNPQGATEYARQIFEKFTAAGLPNCGNNFFSFLQMDFKNSHSKIYGIHSDDVLKAVDNYIEILNDPGCYVAFKYNFEGFVHSKLFTQCLPANFVKDNFKTYEAKNKKADAPAVPEIKKEYPARPTHCVQCGQEIKENEMIDHFSYFCRNCINSYRYNTKAKKWELEVPA